MEWREEWCTSLDPLSRSDSPRPLYSIRVWMCVYVAGLVGDLGLFCWVIYYFFFFIPRCNDILYLFKKKKKKLPKNHQPALLILISAYTSISALVKHLVGRVAAALVTNRFVSIEKMTEVDCPVVKSICYLNIQCVLFIYPVFLFIYLFLFFFVIRKITLDYY